MFYWKQVYSVILHEFRWGSLNHKILYVLTRQTNIKKDKYKEYLSPEYHKSYTYRDIPFLEFNGL